MGYLGNRPAEAYSAFQKQDFSTSATTSYTLDHPVANQNEIALFINFVRQEPTTAYTASGTTLTLTSATSSSDDMYCVYLGKAVQTVNPPNSSVGSSQVSADLITGQTALAATPADTDELLISDAGTLKRVDYSNIKSANTAVFFASKTSGSQSVSHNTWTKVTFDSETFDDDNVFGSNKFTSPSAGKYFFTVQVCVQQGSVLLKTLLNGFYKNGSSIQDQREFETRTDSPLYEYTLNKSIILDLSASDYIEFYIKPQTTDSSATNIRSGSATNLMTFFQGYKLIG